MSAPNPVLSVPTPEAREAAIRGLHANGLWWGLVNDGLEYDLAALIRANAGPYLTRESHMAVIGKTGVSILFVPKPRSPWTQCNSLRHFIAYCKEHA